MQRRFLLTALASVAAPHVAAAQGGYPTRPIRLVVPFPPAGGTDVISRAIAARIQAMSDWNIVA
jgi:tripartite-type tricarboxylate transporter receptor subunit TctC